MPAASIRLFSFDRIACAAYPHRLPDRKISLSGAAFWPWRANRNAFIGLGPEGHKHQQKQMIGNRARVVWLVPPDPTEPPASRDFMRAQRNDNVFQNNTFTGETCVGAATIGAFVCKYALNIEGRRLMEARKD